MDAIEPRRLDDACDELVGALMLGEREAIRTVYRAYHEQVRAFARRLLGSDDDAEEVVQEVFIALPRAVRRYRNDSPLSTFVIGVAVNHARHFIRASARRRAAMRRLAEGTQAPHSASLTELPDESLVREQLVERLLLAMDGLGEAQRVAFVLCERTSQEVAEILGLPSSTVRARVAFARQKLQRALAGEVHK